MDEETPKSKGRASVCLQIGLFKLECEGDEEFLQEKMIGLITKIVDSCAEHVPSFLRQSPPVEVDSGSVGLGSGTGHSKVAGPSCEEFIDKLGLADSKGKVKQMNIVLAAAAKLHFGEEKRGFSSTDIKEVGKNSHHWSQSLESNFSTILKRLVDRSYFARLSKGTYGLTGPKVKEMGDKLKRALQSE